MPRRKRGRRGAATGALMIVRQARAAAKSALDSLRGEISLTTAKLAKLVSEERIFKSELFGASPARKRRGPGRPRKAGRRRCRISASRRQSGCSASPGCSSITRSTSPRCRTRRRSMPA